MSIYRRVHMKEIVKYANWTNTLKFKDFTPQDYDFFMMLCSKMKDKGTRTLTFSFEEIKRLAGYQKKDKKAFVEKLMSMNRKLMSVTTDVVIGSKYLQFVLFTTFTTDTEEDTLTVSINQDFQFVLNDLTKNFTRFELEEFLSLDSKYAKTLYRLIKQYKSTGEYRVNVGEFRDLMGCPPSYNNGVFLRDIVQPSVVKLQQFFPLLQCTVIHAKKRGAPVTGYLFTFNKEERQLTVDQGLEEIRKQREQKNKKVHNYMERDQKSNADLYEQIALQDLQKIQS